MKDLPEIFKNERVSASAGSGKTYALTSRFIALAARETDPETKLPDPTKIAALTFTRKSAGEFLGNILTRLAEAAQNDDAAAALSDEIEKLSVGRKSGGGYITRRDAMRLLRQCVRNLDKLRLSTIDSFFSSVLKIFSNELAIFSEIKILDAFAQKAAETKVVGEILRDNTVDAKTFAAFAETVKRASFGADEKSLRTALDNNLADSRAKFAQTPNVALWGDISKILAPDEIVEWNADDYAAELEKLGRVFEADGQTKYFASLVSFFETSNNNTVGKSSAVVERFAELFANGSLDAPCQIKYRKELLDVSAEAASLAKSLFRRLLSAHVKRACDATIAAGTIAQTYENRYEQTVRKRGMLTFSDIPAMLNSGACPVGGLVEYRLDAKFNHWLFDEFQDTSKDQWEFFKNIIDNVVYDGGGKKTFYYVGDVKQSLYSWRGGDRRLFDEVKNDYNAESENLFDGEPLTTSWRSGKFVIDAVNAFFESERDLGLAFMPNAAGEFCSIFRRHISAEAVGAKKAQPSLAQLRLVRKSEDGETDEFENVCDEIFEIVRKTNPAETGKTCAVLVNDNATVAEIVDALRARTAESGLNIEIAGELEKSAMRDNMIAPAFIQALKLAAHPSDSAAAQYLAMTPLHGFADTPEFADGALDAAASRQISTLAEKFAKYISDNIKLPETADENISRLLETCREFDESELSGIDNFVLFAGEKKYRISTAENSVQVMTIHKSKGLGFGTVILPDLHKIAKRGDRGLKYLTENIGETNTQRQLTITYFPPKAVCALSPVLSQSLEIDAENAAFESICKLYVALTRAERALYVILPEFKFETKDEKFSVKNLILNSFIPELRSSADDKEKKSLFADALALGKISHGDELWFEKTKKDQIAEPIKPLEKTGLPEAAHAAAPSVAPSKAAGEHSAQSADSQRFGKAVHAVFEQIKSVSDTPETCAERAAHAAAIPADIRESVIEKVVGVLKSTVYAPHFEQREDTEVFTEFPFDAFIDGKIVRGIIDRLAVKKSPDGTAESATIVDFKSTILKTDAQTRQLELYREAVSKLYNLPKEKITTLICKYS